MKKSSVSRRSFMGGTAAALGYMGLNPSGDVSAKEFSLDEFRRSSQEYDLIRMRGFLAMKMHGLRRNLCWTL